MDQLNQEESNDKLLPPKALNSKSPSNQTAAKSVDGTKKINDFKSSDKKKKV